MKTKLIHVVALIPLLFTFFSCQLEDGALMNDFDYLHFVTDVTIQNDKLYLGIKNEKDKILANIDLQSLLSTQDKKLLNLNIINRLNYNTPDTKYSYGFIKNHFDNSFTYSKYKNELPLFIKDLSKGFTNCIVPNNYIYSIMNNSNSSLNLNFFFNTTISNNILYSTIFYENNIHFNYKYDTTRINYYNNGDDQVFVSFDVNTKLVDTLLTNDFLKESNEYIRNSFNLNDSIYVCRNNSFLNVKNKSIFTLNELKNDYVVETFQENKSQVLISTLKSKLILLNSSNNYKVFDCLPAIVKEAENNNNYGITEIYLKNNFVYFVAYYGYSGIRPWRSYYSDTTSKYILFSYNLLTSEIKALFSLNEFEALNKYNMLSYYNEENIESKQSNLWSIAVDEQENIYLGCNGLFILDKNGNLLNYLNSFDLARMCKN